MDFVRVPRDNDWRIEKCSYAWREEKQCTHAIAHAMGKPERAKGGVSGEVENVDKPIFYSDKYLIKSFIIDQFPSTHSIFYVHCCAPIFILWPHIHINK